MDRSYYLDLAARGLRMPVGAHLVLHERKDAGAVLRDGRLLADVTIETARRFRTPLAVGVMDLTVEKTALVSALGLGREAADTFHFDAAPTPSQCAALASASVFADDPRLRATAESLRCVAREPGLVPVGMCIGPFSLMTKLVADPITPLFLAGTGVTAEEDPEVARVEAVLALALQAVLASVRIQMEAGARLMFVCEPAANSVYLSPRQDRDDGTDAFERYVLAPNRQVRARLVEGGVDLLFHDCGELTPDRIRRLASLDPVILSLGSSVNLWEAAAQVPRTVVLFGNLPSKRFYSDAEITEAEVAGRTRELLERMKAAGHPFILGTECDVLSVPGCEAAIGRKVAAMLNAGT